MALDTYDGLKAEVAEWLNREDLTAKIPTFISLLEAQINRSLRVREMEARATATADAQFLALPTDFVMLKDIQLNSTPVTVLEPMTLGQLNQIRRDTNGIAGKPQGFGVFGSQLEFAPAPESAYEIEVVYLARVPVLSDTNPSNWVLVAHPDLYLYGTLLQAAPYLHNDDRIGVWDSGVTKVLEEIRVADERSRYGTMPLRARIKPYGSVRP